MKKENFKHLLRQTAGYTIDQTILIVAVIAILITLVIATVGWDLLNRTGGTKLAAQIRQLEDANGTFFARMRIWPQDAVNNPGDPMEVALALADASTLASALLQNKHVNVLPSVDQTTCGGTPCLQHQFGRGGAIMQDVVDLSTAGLSTTVNTGRYMVVELENVPLAEAQEADEAIDGEADYAAGRLIITNSSANSFDCDAAPAAVTGGFVDVCYIANMVN